MKHTQGLSLVSQFERVLESVPARVFNVTQSEPLNTAIAVAYSGGLDSTVLLYLAHAYAMQKSVQLYAFHIHHGLNSKADEWQEHCFQTCKDLKIQFQTQKVKVPFDTGESIEALARQKRYEALASLCQQNKVKLLLTAHHENDQIETILMQLLRGTGVAGLSGMNILGEVPEAKVPTLHLLRPLLTISRQVLEDWAYANNLKWVEDDSNLDIRYTRNAIRREIIPVLTRYFPGFQKNIIRNTQHMQSTKRLLDMVAENDWEICRDENKLNFIKMLELGDDRFNNLFRFWLNKNKLQMPSTSWLNEAKKQLFEARDDAQVKLELDGAIIRRYRQHIFFQKDEKKPVTFDFPIQFVWQGESFLFFESLGGKLYFKPTEKGVDVEWLKAQSLSLQGYYGKVNLKLSPDRPKRLLKLHYQEKGIPAWERQRLPLLYAGKELVFVAGIGTAAERIKEGKNCVLIEWVWMDDAKSD